MMSLSVAMALSGLDADQWTGELKDIYYHGIALIDNNKNISPSPSIASSACVSTVSSTEESGFGSISPKSQYMETFYSRYSSNDIGQTEYRNLHNCDNGLIVTCEKTKTEEIKNNNIKIIYENRDILNLDVNLKNSWKSQSTILAEGVTSFFENRSQHSRLGNVEPPPHIMMICKDLDCQFREPHYM